MRQENCVMHDQVWRISWSRFDDLMEEQGADRVVSTQVA